MDARLQADFLYLMLEETGNTLREARENKGITLHEASEATFIRTRHLKALEEGDFSSMASAAQVRGFLRAYADFLGLDGEMILRSLERSTSDADENLDETQPASRTAAPDRQLEANAMTS